MTTTTDPATDASAVFAAHGVEEDTSYYREFTEPEQKAVLTVPMLISDAWKRNDADRFADMFTENGSLLMQDNQLTSREQIREFMAKGYEGPLAGAYVKGWPILVRFLSPDSAMVITEGGIIFGGKGETDIDDANFIRAIWIIVNKDGEWKLHSHQSSPVKG